MSHHHLADSVFYYHYSNKKQYLIETLKVLFISHLFVNKNKSNATALKIK
jgi:hypothetical protein